VPWLPSEDGTKHHRPDQKHACIDDEQVPASKVSATNQPAEGKHRQRDMPGPTALSGTAVTRLSLASSSRPRQPNHASRPLSAIDDSNTPQKLSACHRLRTSVKMATARPHRTAATKDATARRAVEGAR
jgi:hypothetical protein